MKEGVHTERPSRWCSVEPTPDMLTKLCLDIGVFGTQIEQIMFDKELADYSRPICGFFLFIKHPISSGYDTPSSSRHSEIYFSQQADPRAFAVNALLHILFNSDDDMILSENLRQFKCSTQELSSKLKGLTIENHTEFRQAIYSLSDYGSIENSNELYHPISYIRHSGYLWELDGLKKHPQRLGPCHEGNWLDIARDEMQRKIDLYGQHKVSAWMVVQDKKLAYHKKIIGFNYIKYKTEVALDAYDRNWRNRMNIAQWEEEYHFAMSCNKRIRRGQVEFDKLCHHHCQSFHQLPSEEQAFFKQMLKEYMGRQDKVDIWLSCQDQVLRLYENIGFECEKKATKQFDYIPFIKAYVCGLYEEGHLQAIINPS